MTDDNDLTKFVDSFIQENPSDAMVIGELFERASLTEKEMDICKVSLNKFYREFYREAFKFILKNAGTEGLISSIIFSDLF